MVLLKMELFTEPMALESIKCTCKRAKHKEG